MAPERGNFKALMDALSYLFPLASENENPTDNQSDAGSPAETLLKTFTSPPSGDLVQEPHFGLILERGPAGGELYISYSGAAPGVLLTQGNWFKIPRGAPKGFYVVGCNVAGDYLITLIRDRWYEPSPRACCDAEGALVLGTEDGLFAIGANGNYILVT